MKRKVIGLVGIMTILIVMLLCCGTAMAESGNYDGIDWDLTDGVLTLGNGETQTLSNRSSRDCSSWPWNGIRDSITEVKCKGTLIMQGSIKGMFYQCTNMVKADLSGFDTSNVTSIVGNSVGEGIFNSCSSLTDLNVSGWDTRNITRMNYVFSGCSSLESVDLSDWDTSNVTNMSGLCSGCINLKSINLEGWDTSKVTTMARMFENCSNLESLDVSQFDTSSVTVMHAMFRGCKNLVSLAVTDWDTSEVTNMIEMFNGCNALEVLDVSGWNTDNVTSMSNMFVDCHALSTIDVCQWNTINVTDMRGLFAGCYSVEVLDVSEWDTSNVVDMAYLFSDCRKIVTLDLSEWNTARVTDMTLMFRRCYKLEKIDMSGFNTSKTVTMNSRFENCTNLKTVILGENNPFIGANGTVLSQCTLPVPPGTDSGIQYTRKWIREDKTYGPYTPSELGRNYTSAMAGTWVWEKVPTEYRITFVCNEDGYVGAMPQVTVDASSDYELPGNAFRVFSSEFEYWTDGTRRTWKDKAIIPANTYAVDAEVTLTAVFLPRDRSIDMQDGAFDFSIKGNEKALFQPIPASTSYQVYEQTPFGWNLIKQSNNVGEIMPDEESEALFLNKYDPLKVTIRFAGTKLMNESAADPDSFNFLLYEDETLIDIASVSEGGAIEFQPIEYDAAGDHHYYIKEVIGSDNTVEYDTHAEEIMVSITSDGVGHLFADVTMDENQILFENKSKPGMLVLRKLNATTEDRDGVFYYEVQFSSENGQPYDLLSSDVSYEEREGDISDFPDTQPLPDKPKYTLTVTQNYHNKSGRIESAVTTEEFSQGDLFSLEWVGKPVADVTITEGEDFLLKSGSGWKGIMPAQDLNVTVNYSNTYAILDKNIIREFTVSEHLPYAVYLTRGNGTVTYNPYDRRYDVDDGTTECVVQFTREGSYDIYHWYFNWYTNADVIYLPEDSSYLFARMGTNAPYEGFANAGKFDLLNYVDSSRATNMKGMFQGCGWKTLDLSNLNTDNVTDMSYMFSGTSYDSANLEELDLSNFNTSNVTDMSHMFEDCYDLTSLDLSNWNTSNVTNMSKMFYRCIRLPVLDLSEFDTSRVTDMTDMYNVDPNNQNRALRTVILGEHNPFVGDDTSAVLPSPVNGSVYTNGEYITYTGKWIREDGAYGPYTSEELRDNYTGAMAGKWVWQVAPPTATISKSLWQRHVNGGGGAYGSGVLRSKKTFSRNTTYTSVSELPTSAKQIDDGEAYPIYFWTDGDDAYWWSEAETVYMPTSAYEMFSYCSSLVTLDLSDLDTSKVTNMSKMFDNCTKLKSLDLSSFDTASVTDMSSMFNYCYGLISLDLSSFDTTHVTSMNRMFNNCYNLVSVNLSSFYTPVLTDMDIMFYDCHKLTSLNLSSFDTSHVTAMTYMFTRCYKLESLDLSSFDTSNVNMNQMYSECSSLSTFILGLHNPFVGSGTTQTIIPTPPTSSNGVSYTGKWIREDGAYGPYTPAELRANYTSEMAGRWIWQVR